MRRGLGHGVPGGLSGLGSLGGGLSGPVGGLGGDPVGGLGGPVGGLGGGPVGGLSGPVDGLGGLGGLTCGFGSAGEEPGGPQSDRRGGPGPQ
ncbi:MAG TPA: hypothetical protein ENK57_07815 [Polyangiaceae bacterium]|nr:hypothetical protein [Polyangiaceae bacterium]